MINVIDNSSGVCPDCNSDRAFYDFEFCYYKEICNKIYNLIGSTEDDKIKRLRELKLERIKLERYLHRELRMKE